MASNCFAASALVARPAWAGQRFPGWPPGTGRGGRSQDPQLGIQGAGVLDGLENGDHVPGRDADGVEHFASRPTEMPGSMVSVFILSSTTFMSFCSVATVCLG